MCVTFNDSPDENYANHYRFEVSVTSKKHRVKRTFTRQLSLGILVILVNMQSISASVFVDSSVRWCNSE